MKANRLEHMASPARSPDGGAGLLRSTSVKAPSSLLFSVNASHQLPRASVSTPTTPSYSRQKLPSINCMAVTSATDTPPATPKDKQPKPMSASASYYASMWSPRKLMQRASRAFRGAGKSRRKKNMDVGDSPKSVASKGSDVGSVQSLDEIIEDVHGEGAKQEEHHLEVVPEKIIHEANPPVVNPQPAVAEEEEECTMAPEKETAAAAAEGEEEEEPKKGAALAPAPVDVADGAVTDKFMMVKEVTKKSEEEIMEEVVRRFQGSRVKTAMEKRSDEEQPRRREVARSNDVIEEARSKLLEKRQGSRVKALVGAFETVMEGNHHHATAAGKLQLHGLDDTH